MAKIIENSPKGHRFTYFWGSGKDGSLHVGRVHDFRPEAHEVLPRSDGDGEAEEQVPGAGLIEVETYKGAALHTRTAAEAMQQTPHGAFQPLSST